MKNSILFLVFVSFFILSTGITAQDKGIFKETKNAFWDKVKKSTEEFKKKKEEEHKSFVVDLSGYALPKSVDEFTSYWHNEPISQANSNTCWSFSTTSFFECEIFRLFGKKVQLSPMWTAYWEFVEKARGFVQHRGEWSFQDGSESNAVSRIWEKYGVVPADVYTGLLPGQEFLNTSDMFDEMKGYLDFVKENNMWNEEEVITTIKSIMDHWIGTPPEKFTLDGKEFTPKEYLKNYLKLNLDDYAEVMSLVQQPYWEQVEYEVSDNWWHNKDYYNVPLDVFMEIIKKGIRNGHTICIGGDVSEPGKNPELDVFMVPSFDIPTEYIDENARQFRFSNETSTDDHGVHMVGYLQKDGKDWYLIKDSESSSRNGNNVGYYFFSEDYVKLKMLGFTIHKEVLGDLLDKFKE
ncbi:MAG: peptidase C1 [Ignavibacteria bacterium RBG_13_36_8]|nr:MAG: peptidase C1 [Ignavibacteria bacterium RBG_13_36_8]